MVVLFMQIEGKDDQPNGEEGDRGMSSQPNKKADADGSFHSVFLRAIPTPLIVWSKGEDPHWLSFLRKRKM